MCLTEKSQLAYHVVGDEIVQVRKSRVRNPRPVGCWLSLAFRSGFFFRRHCAGMFKKIAQFEFVSLGVTFMLQNDSEDWHQMKPHTGK